MGKPACALSSFMGLSYRLPLEKTSEEEQALGGPFLGRRVAAIGELDDLGVLEDLTPARQVAGEGRVLHAPDQDRRNPRDAVAPRPKTVVPGARTGELARADPGGVTVERAQVVLLDLARVAPAVGHRVAQHHLHREGAALVEVTPKPAAENPGEPFDVPVAGERPHPRVEDHQPAHVFRVVERVRETDRTAEVVDGERDVLELERLDETREVPRLVLGTIRPARRAIAQPEAQVVRRDAPVARAQLADKAAIQERPRGRAVHHDDRIALAGVDVAQTTALDVEPLRLERVLPAVDPRRNQRGGSFVVSCWNAFTISGSGVPIGNT